MASVIQYPTINGVRASFASVEFRFNGQIFIGVKSLNYSRKRTRALVRGNHPDPLGKTLGENEYTADAEFYLAEWNLFQSQLDSQALAYGDQPFTVVSTYSANGFDTIQDTLIGCTLDSTEAGLSQGPDGLVRKFELSPLKIFFNGLDDLTAPLQGVP